jgi:acyl-CoA synthetase (NDP forming)
MSLLSPSSIAIIGASAEEKKVGHIVLKNLISQGYKGAIYPVNPKGGEILGKTAYASVAAIPGEVDLAVVVTPAKTVVDLAEECGKKGVKTLVVISADV